MSYKSYYKKSVSDGIIARIQIIQLHIQDERHSCDIARQFSMHRNTVRNILTCYETNATEVFRTKILTGEHFSLQEVDSSLCEFLRPQSRKPKQAHPQQAPPNEEERIVSLFASTRVGAKKLVMILRRRNDLRGLTIGQIRGIYKRRHLRVQKVRTKNGETRSLYNYEQLGAFEHLHLDTKELADAKSLPPAIYENLKHNEHIPLYEWNLIDAATRMRFMAYSRGKSSTAGLQFLVYVLSHLRYCGIARPILVHTDGGAEFFSGSSSKQEEWNSILQELDAHIDCYNPSWDIRKNLIERSHRSDDEEFLIAFGGIMTTRKVFYRHAQQYNDYWNTKRGHSGKNMHGQTPEERLLSLGIYQAARIVDFKVLNLDARFYDLQEHLEYFLWQRELRNTPKEKLLTDKKISVDLVTRYPHLREYAQNVFAYYQFARF